MAVVISTMATLEHVAQTRLHSRTTILVTGRKLSGFAFE